MTLQNTSKSMTLAFFLLILFISCKKLVDVKPPVTATTEDNVFSNDATAASVLTGIYTSISQGSLAHGSNSISFLSSLYTDELTLFLVNNTTYDKYYKNALTSNDESIIGTGASLWYQAYPYVFIVNSAIEGLEKSTSLTPVVKNQLLGEAKFLRAFFNFYLTNFYGDIPLPLTTDYKLNSSLPRSPKNQVFSQIVNDLLDAQNKLSTGYLRGDLLASTSERVRPTKWAATALLARIYLFNGDFSNAEAQANAVINNSSMYGLTSLDSVFLKNSTEAIWQLQPGNLGWNTEDAKLFNLSSPPAGLNDSHPVYIDSGFYSTFDGNDKRKTKWIDTFYSGTDIFYYPNKYKSALNNAPVTEYLMVLRLGEQYLIRSEAKAQQNKIASALDDLNMIRTRANLSPESIADKDVLLSAILKERRFELFTEWAHRFIDLKRFGKIDIVMGSMAPTKGGTWSSYKSFYPVPQGELNKNLSLVQNPGY